VIRRLVYAPVLIIGLSGLFDRLDSTPTCAAVAITVARAY
jgi:hypothetical protein